MRMNHIHRPKKWLAHELQRTKADGHTGKDESRTIQKSIKTRNGKKQVLKEHIG